MGFLKNYLEAKKQYKLHQNDEYMHLIESTQQCIQEYESFFKNKNIYIDPNNISVWEKKWFYVLQNNDNKKLKKTRFYDALSNNLRTLSIIDHNKQSACDSWNLAYVNAKIPVAHSLICPTEGRNLDYQQLSCIVKDAANCLVVAGAGTGKTTTIIGKIKYLLKTNTCNPQDIGSLVYKLIGK